MTILYYTTVIPFDGATLKEHNVSSKIMLCEPYYQGVLLTDILNVLWPKPVLIDCVGVPHRFLTDYGQAEEHDEFIGLTAGNIRKRIKRIMNE